MASAVWFGGSGCGPASEPLGPVCGEDSRSSCRAPDHHQGARPWFKVTVLIPVQELTKDLEDKSGLMAAVVGAGAQMVQLREEEEEEGGGTPDSAQTRLQSQLRQVELDWSRLLADVPAFRVALQEVRTSLPPRVPGAGLGLKHLLVSRWWFLSPQRCLRTSSRQGALQELQTWVDSAETRLEELLSQTGTSRTELSGRLKDCRVNKH